MISKHSTLTMVQVDVFATSPLSGNAAMVVFGGQKLSDEQMQAIARETNLSETAFILPASQGGNYKIRTFTTKREIPFAGHPTLAAAHAYSELICPSAEELRQEDGLGIRTVKKVNGDEDWSVALPPMDSHESAPREKDVLAQMLGLPAASLASVEPRVFATGVPWILVELTDLASLRRVSPDHSLIAVWTKESGAVGLTVYVEEGDPGADISLRSFAPAEGIYEDPVCGSCAGSIAASKHLRSASHTPPQTINFSQGQELGRNGRLFVTSDGEAQLELGGKCLTSIRGTLRMLNN